LLRDIRVACAPVQGLRAISLPAFGGGRPPIPLSQDAPFIGKKSWRFSAKGASVSHTSPGF